MPDNRNPDSHNLDNRDLDLLIDEALSSYTAAEPDPSLRVRIMAHAAEAAPRPKRLWLLAPAAACAAAIAIAFLWQPSTHVPRSVLSASTVAASAPAPTPAAVEAMPQKTIHPHPALAAHCTRRSETSAPIRQASFPSPAPLTAQENILLKFATEHPEQARQVLTASAARPIENAPLSIAPIYIAALSEKPQSQQSQ